MSSPPSADTSASPDPRAARRLEMLDELAEMTLDLASAVRDHVKIQLVRSAEGYAPDLPADPSAAYVKLGQCLRRTVALHVHLSEGGTVGDKRLFAAPPWRGIDLHPPAPSVRTPAAGPDAEAFMTVPREIAADFAEPRESIAQDLGRLLDDPERLIDVRIGPIDATIAELCRTVGLDPNRLHYDDRASGGAPEPQNAVIPERRGTQCSGLSGTQEIEPSAPPRSASDHPVPWVPDRRGDAASVRDDAELGVRSGSTAAPAAENPAPAGSSP